LTGALGCVGVGSYKISIITTERGNIVDALGTIGEIANIAALIHNQVGLVKANKRQCETLSQRITVINDTLNQVVRLPFTRRQALLPGLKRLQHCLQQSHAFIAGYADQNSWYKKALVFIQAGGINDDFQELQENLQQAVNDLNLGINVRQLFNDADTQRAMQQDFTQLKGQMQQLITLNVQALNAIEQSDLRAEDRQQILLQQMTALLASVQAEGEATRALLQRELQQSSPIKLPGVSHIQHYPDLQCPIESYQIRFESLIYNDHGTKVYKGFYNNQPVAIKMLPDHFHPQDAKLFAREVAIMRKLNHPSLVNFIGANIEQGQAFLVMEYMSKGNLANYLKSNPVLPATQRLQIAADIADGIKALHQQHILHRNLNSNNVLLNAQGRAKISDFANCKISSASIQTLLPAQSATTAQAPELALGATHNKQTEMWQLGHLLQDLLADIDSMKDTINACLHRDPDQRPSIDDVVATIAEHIYQRGTDSQKCGDLNGARVLYESAANFSHTRALANLGFFALKGQAGFDAAKQQGLDFLLRAAEKDPSQGGVIRARFNLAVYFKKSNPAEALHWFRRAAHIAPGIEVNEETRKIMQQADVEARKLEPAVATSAEFLSNFATMEL